MNKKQFQTFCFIQSPRPDSCMAFGSVPDAIHFVVPDYSFACDAIVDVAVVCGFLHIAFLQIVVA